MKCPKCLSKGVKKIPAAQVIDTRPTDGGAMMRRRRICPKCDHRWTTAEVVVDMNGYAGRNSTRAALLLSATSPEISGGLRTRLQKIAGEIAEMALELAGKE